MPRGYQLACLVSLEPLAEVGAFVEALVVARFGPAPLALHSKHFAPFRARVLREKIN